MTAFDIASLRFDERGLIPAIAQARDGEVLMLAWMNAESLAETLRDRRRHLLVAVAGRALAQGRDLGPRAAAGRAARRLRPRLPAADRRPDRAGLPHQPAELLLHRGARRRGGRAVASRSRSRAHPADRLRIRRASAVTAPAAPAARQRRARGRRRAWRGGGRPRRGSARWWCQTGTGSPSSACSRRCSGVASSRSSPRTTWVTPWCGVVDHDREVIGAAPMSLRASTTSPSRASSMPRSRRGCRAGAGRSRSRSAADVADEVEGAREVEADGVARAGRRHAAAAAGAGIDSPSGVRRRPPAAPRARRGCRRGCSGRDR